MQNSPNKVELVPATAEHIHAFFGRGLKQTVRALAMVRGEEVLGIGGFYVDESRVVTFSDIKPEGRKYRKAIVRAAYEVLGMAHRLGLPAHAVADPSIEGSEYFLAQLGFVPLDYGVWEWR